MFMQFCLDLHRYKLKNNRNYLELQIFLSHWATVANTEHKVASASWTTGWNRKRRKWTFGIIKSSSSWCKNQLWTLPEEGFDSWLLSFSLSWEHSDCSNCSFILKQRLKCQCQHSLPPLGIVLASPPPLKFFKFVFIWGDFYHTQNKQNSVTNCSSLLSEAHAWEVFPWGWMAWIRSMKVFMVLGHAGLWVTRESFVLPNKIACVWVCARDSDVQKLPVCYFSWFVHFMS